MLNREQLRDLALSPRQLESIKAHLTADLRPVVPLPSSSRLFMTLFLLSGIVVSAGLIEFGERGWQAMPVLARATVLAPLLATACCTVLVIVRSTFPEAEDSRTTVACAAGMFALSVAAVVCQLDAQEEQRFFAVGLRCVRAGVLHWLIAVACLAGLVARGVFVRPVVISAATGALAAVLAVATSEIRCPNPYRLHSLAWHLSLPLIGIGVGMLVGILLSVRAATVTRVHLNAK